MNDGYNGSMIEDISIFVVFVNFLLFRIFLENNMPLLQMRAFTIAQNSRVKGIVMVGKLLEQMNLNIGHLFSVGFFFHVLLKLLCSFEMKDWF